VLDDAGHRSLQLAEIGRAVVRAATALGRERDHAVDVRVLGHDLRILEVLGDLAGGRRGAIDGGEDADVVAGADPAVLAAEAHERPPLCLRHVLDRRVLAGVSVIERQAAFTNRQVV
jgi:hypothetical protein